MKTGGRPERFPVRQRAAPQPDARRPGMPGHKTGITRGAMSPPRAPVQCLTQWRVRERPVYWNWTKFFSSPRSS